MRCCDHIACHRQQEHGALKRGHISVGRINLLLLVMLVVSAAVHCGVVLLVPMALRQEPAKDSSELVRILMSTMPQVQTQLPVISRQLSETVEPQLPEVDLPDLTTASAQMEKSVPERSAASRPVPLRQTMPAKATSDRTIPSQHHIRAAVTKILREIPADEPRSSVAASGKTLASSSPQHEAGDASSAASGGKLDTYLQNILRKIEREKYYPRQARSRGHEGKTSIRFLLQVDGHIAAPIVQRRSGYAILDHAALQAVKRAAPFPPRPEGERNGVIPLEITLAFQLNGHE